MMKKGFDLLTLPSSMHPARLTL